MNLIAINLGLAPVPPLPPSVAERQRVAAQERERAAGGVRSNKTYGEAFRRQLLDMLRDTGSGTTLDLAVSMGTNIDVLRPHLERIERDELVRRESRRIGSRSTYIWHAVGVSA